jgi:hypothetical protein
MINKHLQDVQFHDPGRGMFDISTHAGNMGPEKGHGAVGTHQGQKKGKTQRKGEPGASKRLEKARTRLARRRGTTDWNPKKGFTKPGSMNAKKTFSIKKK